MLFDEDKNGNALLDDVQRVLSTYTDLSAADQEKFIKLCAVGVQLSEEQERTAVKDLGLPKGFSIKQAASHVFNI